jgi:hypothetical protein
VPRFVVQEDDAKTAIVRARVVNLDAFEGSMVEQSIISAGEAE